MTVWTVDSRVKHGLSLKYPMSLALLYVQVVLCAINLLLLTATIPLVVFGRRDFQRTHESLPITGSRGNEKSAH